MTVRDLLAEHGSPRWMADADRVRERFDGFLGAWSGALPAVDVHYSYKTNRTTAVLRAPADAGADEQVQSTQFAELRPAVVVRDGDRWRPHRRRETLADLVRLDQEEPSWSA